jgi:hypothetical protein
MVSQWFGLKIIGTVFSDLASKSVATVSPSLASKPVVEGFPVWASVPAARFGDLGLKITAVVSGFGPQNQAVYGLSVTPQNRWEGDRVEHMSRSSGGLGFCSLASRLAEARRRLVHVAPSRRLCRGQVEDGRVDTAACVGPCYPYFTVFFLLGSMGNLVF